MENFREKKNSSITELKNLFSIFFWTEFDETDFRVVFALGDLHPGVKSVIAKTYDCIVAQFLNFMCGPNCLNFDCMHFRSKVPEVFAKLLCETETFDSTALQFTRIDKSCQLSPLYRRRSH